MVNALKMEKRDLIIRLFNSGWSNRKINKATGIHRKTISDYRKAWEAIKDNEEPEYPISSDRNSESMKGDSQNQNVPPETKIKCPPGRVVHFEVSTDPRKAGNKLPDISQARKSKSRAAVHDSIIRQKLKKSQNARSIYQDLYVEEGYRGSYNSVKRYVRKLKEATPKLYARLETLPGEEAQVDFGKGAPTLRNGRYLKPWLFVMTLSYSRKSYEEVIWSQTVESFIRCHERAFDHFGGVVEVVKLDNLKSAVLRAHLYEPEMNPNYLAFSKHMGFVPLPCKVATPEHKGIVEAGIKYVKNNALKAKYFESLEAQNRYLRHWNKTWATTRIHGTTKRQVRQMFSEERSSLKPLPEKAFVFFKIGTRKVNSLDSHIEVGGAYYPIPPEYMSKRVDVHFNSQWVKVFYQGNLIQWLSVIDKGRFHPDKSCLPEDKRLNRNAWQKRLLEQCTSIGSPLRHWADQAVLSRGLLAYRAIQGVVSLRKKFSGSLLNKACVLALERQAFTYHLVRHYAEELSIKQEIETRQLLSQEGDIIRSCKSYADLMAERMK